jgi:hypothetical protein
MGDPLLRLPHPKQIAVSAPSSATAGEEISISGTCDLNGPCIVELVVPRDRLAFRPTPRPQFEPTNTALSAYQETYLKANDGRLASAQTLSTGGAFAARLTVPAATRGECYVRVFVASQQDCAHGAATLQVLPVAKP